jgi:hypothetical protein
MTRGSFRAALSQKAGAGVEATRGGPRAAPSRETGAGATGTCGSPGAGRREPEPWGHVATLKLPRARSRESEPQGHAAALELPKPGSGSRGLGTRGLARSPCLLSYLKLVCQGTQSSGYRQGERSSQGHIYKVRFTSRSVYKGKKIENSIYLSNSLNVQWIFLFI